MLDSAMATITRFRTRTLLNLKVLRPSRFSPSLPPRAGLDDAEQSSAPCGSAIAFDHLASARPAPGSHQTSGCEASAVYVISRGRSGGRADAGRSARRDHALDRPRDGGSQRCIAALGAADLGGARPPAAPGSSASSCPPIRRSRPSCATWSLSISIRRRTVSFCRSTRRAMCGWPPARKRKVGVRDDQVACGHVSGLLTRSSHDRWPRWVPQTGASSDPRDSVPRLLQASPGPRRNRSLHHVPSLASVT